jgi:nucleoside-diphosphate-sugar epimerase
MAATEKILIIGSGGQIGTELTESLRKKYGNDSVIASDVKERTDMGSYEVLDVLDKDKLFDVIKKHKITQVYLLAALLSATAEKNIKFAWQLNMEGLFNVLDLAKEKHINKVYWPSSIAVFGPTTPRENTPQFTVMEPNTVYGISKQAGERWCEYYFNKFQVDVRSLRYPGLISYKSAPGGGTTDYAVHIFHEAIKNKAYTSFLSENSTLPMMYMPDAIRATVELMEASPEKVKIRSSYNLAGISFSPKQIGEAIKKRIPEFRMDYSPDFRQAIADSWPASIDDSRAQQDWGWKKEFELDAMVDDMLKNIKI